MTAISGARGVRDLVLSATGQRFAPGVSAPAVSGFRCVMAISATVQSRRILIEVAWSYSVSQPGSAEMLLRQEGLSKAIRRLRNVMAQERLCRRFRGSTQAGNLPTVVTAAIARELSGSQSPLNSGFLFSRKALTASR